jgi:hypothetical protein
MLGALETRNKVSSENAAAGTVLAKWQPELEWGALEPASGTWRALLWQDVWNGNAGVLRYDVWADCASTDVRLTQCAFQLEIFANCCERRGDASIDRVFVRFPGRKSGTLHKDHT